MHWGAHAYGFTVHTGILKWLNRKLAALVPIHVNEGIVMRLIEYLSISKGSLSFNSIYSVFVTDSTIQMSLSGCFEQPNKWHDGLACIPSISRMNYLLCVSVTMCYTLQLRTIVLTGSVNSVLEMSVWEVTQNRND